MVLMAAVLIGATFLTVAVVTRWLDHWDAVQTAKMRTWSPEGPLTRETAPEDQPDWENFARYWDQDTDA